MTRIAVISDSHGGMLHLERFAKMCEVEKFDRVFHLGDIMDDVYWLQKHVDISIDAVAGNCDVFARQQREFHTTVEGKRILLTHGDRHDVKYGCTKLSYYGEENMMDCVLFGHTHRSFAGYVGGVLLINPGALKNGSMCILEVTAKDIVPRILDIDDWYTEHMK